MKVRLYIKPYCPWCHKAMSWLDDHGIRYETLDVIADSRGLHGNGQPFRAGPSRR